jgi:4-amino-4-deoxy-L-arabinose transferase-like glycosyltransferase
MTIAKRLSGFPTWLFLILIGLLVFVPFLGNVHLFDWDEVNFAESAREMLLTHNYRMVQINFQPFYEKPPFFIWLQALSMSYFGVNEFAARFPNALIGIATLITVYNTGKRYFDANFGIWWAMLFTCSILPQLYFKSGIIDPVFNYFIYLSLYLLFIISIKDDFESPKLGRKNHLWYMVASALAAGVAVLVKGPVALGLIVSTVSIILFINRGKLNFNLTDLIIWLLVITIVIGAWLTFEIRANGVAFIHNFIAYQIRLFTTEDAGHGGPIYFHLLALIIGCFPASVLCLESFRRNPDDTLHQVSFKRWMIVLLVVTLFVFSIVKTKIIHYSSLCYFPVTFLGAYYIYHLTNNRWKWSWRQYVPVFLLGSIFALIIGAAIWIGSYHISIPFFGEDQFASAALKAVVYWSPKELIMPIAFFVALIVGLILIGQKRVTAGLWTILIATCLFTNLMMAIIVPRMEKYSQGAMIEFLQAKKTEDCYIEVLGFKSYAQLFYYDKKIPATRQDLDLNYIVWGPTTKPVYIITRVTKLGSFYDPNKFQELYRKNGYVFFKKLK